MEYRGGFRHFFEREAVAVWVWIVELPSADELLNLIAQRAVGVGARHDAPFVRVHGEFREHAHERVRDVLPRRARGRLHEFDDGIDRHSLRRVDDELFPLPRVAAHFEQARECIRLQRAHHTRNAFLQCRGFLAAFGFQLFGDLQQVPYHDLIVRGVLLVLVDRLRHNHRIRGLR